MKQERRRARAIAIAATEDKSRIERMKFGVLSLVVSLLVGLLFRLVF